ncbi:MAG TPA: LysR family transcriptional regulator [Burkholderiales bacterium]|nr:LysR family transcriptional regulator [Burkholderiales bacterium]
MDRLGAMAAFTRCVERGSFSAVARELRVTQPTVSKQIAALERHLGGRLFARSSRHLRLTAEGRRFYEECCAILGGVEAAEASFRTGRTEVSGLLRVAAGTGFGRVLLMGRMRAFLQRYPALRVDLHLSDGFVDIVEQGIDVAFRVGELPDSSLVARRISTTHRVTVGSPEYLARRGEPRRPEDLAAHDCILHTPVASQDVWPYVREGRACPVRVRGAFQSNSGEAVRAAVLAGIGLALSPVWLFGEDLRAKRVRLVLPEYRSRPLPVHAVFPANRRDSAKVRACVEYFQAEFERDPFMSAYRP